MIAAGGFTVACVAAMLIARDRGYGEVASALKMAASCGFLFAAWGAGALESAYGRIILAGLAFSWFGDLFLIYRGNAAFLAGLVAFLVAHVAYIAAFAVRGIAWNHAALSLIVLAPFLAGVLWWLMPHVDGAMRGPVCAYAIVITGMVAAAAGVLREPWGRVILTGAVLFYLSDVFVARSQFVHSTPWNGRIGLPLYYAGQLLLALSPYALRR